MYKTRIISCTLNHVGENFSVGRVKLVTKYNIIMDKKNICTMKNGKSFEFKNSGKKKGLTLRNAENQAICNTMMVQQYPSISKEKFQVYLDVSNENDRSRSRVKKDVHKEEIRARARSSSNCRQNALLDKINMNSKLSNYPRSCSESRGIPLQYAQSSNVQTTKHLTNDVKKRTLSSIQMWKKKMRKPYIGTVPKNMTTNTNLYKKTLSQNGINKINSRTNLQKSSVTGSMNLQPEMSQNHAKNPNEGIERARSIDSLTNVLKLISNEIAIFLQDKSPLTTQNDTNKSFNSLIPLEGSFILPLTSTKVHYEKCVMTQKLSAKKENEFDFICETPYELDYLEDIPETERKRDNNAPRLSPHFLRENVNAEQRRIVVGYIIHLGVHCCYSSYVIYQTVKLFNVAIDRIHVKTNDIQLMALACLWIILKQDAPNHKIPSATIILQLARDLYINQEKLLLKYEKKILCAIKFNTRFADPYSLLSYYMLNVNQDSRCNIVKPGDMACVYFCGSYMIDICMLDENLCEIPVYIIATTAIELSLRIVYFSDVNVDQEWYQVWRIKQSLTEWEERMLNSTKQIMMQRIVECNDFGSKVIYKKYMRSKHGKVTNFLHNKLKNCPVVKD